MARVRGIFTRNVVPAPEVLATAISFWLFGREQLPDVVMVYLLGIMLVSSRVGFGASLFAGAAAVFSTSAGTSCFSRSGCHSLPTSMAER